jgi:hypothetical protein
MAANSIFLTGRAVSKKLNFQFSHFPLIKLLFFSKDRLFNKPNKSMASFMDKLSEELVYFGK